MINDASLMINQAGNFQDENIEVISVELLAAAKQQQAADKEEAK